jgi:hypothetical protein
MKRLACVAVIAAMTAAAPAIALPNMFWTFGWDFPSRSKPWTFGRARERSDLRLAARSRAEREPVAALAVPPATMALAVAEPDPLALAVAVAASIPDEPTMREPARMQMAEATAARMLAYDVMGL